ncbi:MAG: cupin domain-containing protein [Proteobacteria bacterium]|nr:cupin domain-containing protein [Pseudomonadota bacterium]NOG59295.1 cupin domain-containing protein [Pseudomonadota bacterium]
MQLLGGISREKFLKEYWQKKPLLIRQAFSDYQSPVSPEELGGLACEEEVESRIIQEKGGEQAWQLRHGPFIESDFTSLPETHWTLLVQSVDHHVPELACLLDKFDFIPTWRIDDLMISFAQAQGSVGPHIDNYDVFLLQVQGERHWYINENDYADDDFIKDSELRILKEFESTQDWLLEPGDMLYLPPGVAHHGVAVDDCLTFSIGFRAPTRNELLIAYTEKNDDAIADAFYSDPDLSLQTSPGEIKKEHIDIVQALMRLSNVDKDEFSSWFGCFITEKTNELEHENKEFGEHEFWEQYKHFGKLTRNGYIRLSYIGNNESISLFVAGEEFVLSDSYLSLARYLCENHSVDYNRVIQYCDETAASELLFKLYNNNYLFFDE